jgi:hypothetical protein
MRQSRQGKRTDPDVRQAIEDLVVRGWSATEIVSKLDTEHKFVGRVPRERAVRGIARRLRRSDASGEWQLEDSDQEETRAVLDSLGAVLRISNGARTYLSKDEAAWVGRVFAAAPTLNPWLRYKLAVFYATRRSLGRPTVDLDAFLALAPWQGGDFASQYIGGVKAGVFPPPPWPLQTDGSAAPSHGDEQDDATRSATSAVTQFGALE